MWQLFIVFLISYQGQIPLYGLLVLGALIGLMPGFSVSSYASLLLIGTIIWLSKNLTLGLGDIVPSGAPTALVPFLIVIEIISLLVRPCAIVLRITINLLCGHLLLVVFPPLLLLPLEVMVCVIQGYVYSLILVL